MYIDGYIHVHYNHIFFFIWVFVILYVNIGPIQIVLYYKRFRVRLNGRKITSKSYSKIVCSKNIGILLLLVVFPFFLCLLLSSRLFSNIWFLFIFLNTKCWYIIKFFFYIHLKKHFTHTHTWTQKYTQSRGDVTGI